MKKYELYLREEASWDTDNERLLLDSEAVHEFAKQQLQIQSWDREKFVIVALNCKNKVIGYNIAAVGNVNNVMVDPREVLKFLLLANAAFAIVIHNHPSGEVTPSKDDIDTTARLKAALNLVNIGLVDHVIFGDYGYFSMGSAGMLN
ncbi:JAB domain-containing protein [Anaerovoracaceae bacterium 42-11]